MNRDIVQLINQLSVVLAGGTAQPGDVADAIGVQPVPDNDMICLSDLHADLEIVKVPSGDLVWSVIVSFAKPFPLALLESAYGSSSALPRSRPGGHRRVRFATLNQSVTLLADTEPDDLVKTVTVQADLVEV